VFRRAPWPYWTAGAAVVAVLVWLYDRSACAIACGQLPIRVVGVVVDAAGSPVEGASLLTLIDPEDARDSEYVEKRRECTREEVISYAPVWGSGRTDPGGAFEIITGIPISHTYGRLGITWHTERGSAYKVARGLLVEKEGYAPLVNVTKDARWHERREGGLVGTLEVGTIRLERLGGR
jgi:hypothetical protein